MRRLNLAVFISGRGSNLQSLIDACEQPDFPARIRVVVSNEPEAYGLERAKAADIPTEVVAHKAYKSRREFEDAVSATLAKYPVDLICLAGFMRILTPEFVARWEGRMLNIHPSLLPAYTGLHTHERVLAAAEKESGCTIHFVTPGLDEGPTLIQRRVPVLSGDTPDSLAARILAEEHTAYPEAVRLIAEDRVTYRKDFVEIRAAAPYTSPEVSGVTPPTNYHNDTALEIPAMDHHSTSASTDTAPDEATIAQAQALFDNFLVASKVLIVGVGAILIAMALFLL